jgi:predicted transglutaminase-like cysteine proteinase
MALVHAPWTCVVCRLAMARIGEKFRNLMSPGTAGDARITRDEVQSAAAGATNAELRTLAAQAVDAFDSTEALGVLTARVGNTAVQAPLVSLLGQAASRNWRNGDFTVARTATGEAKEAVKLLQRALVKIGAHHAGGTARPDLMQLPWGADGQFGGATARAVNAAMELAGRPDLATTTADSELGQDVAEVVESLLAQTPRVMLPQLVPVPPPPPPRATALFGCTPTPITRLAAYEAKWAGVLARIEDEKPGWRLDNPDLAPSTRAWLEGLDEAAPHDRHFQLNRVNSLVNEWPYEADTPNYGGDHLASPNEFLTRHGDCEDYAITKYASLLRLGFPEESMRLVVVQDRQASNAMHAVLAVELDGATYILDNQSQLAMRDSEVLRYPEMDARYRPLAAINRDGRWLYGPPA